VMGKGRVSFIEDREQKRHGLNVIMKQVSDREWEFPEEKLEITTLFKIEIDTISARQNFYNRKQNA